MHDRLDVVLLALVSELQVGVGASLEEGGLLGGAGLGRRVPEKIGERNVLRQPFFAQNIT